MSAPTKRYLEEAVGGLFEPLLKRGHDGHGWKLLGWDAEQGLCVTLQKGAALVYVEFEDRDEAVDCYARTSHFNVLARCPFAAGTSLSEQERGAVDRLVAMAREREDRLATFERPTTARRRTVREILVDRVLVPEGRNHYYINPYVGCMIGCSFCYVIDRADLSRRLEGLPRMEWGRYLDVKVNAPEVLAEELKRHPPGVVRMSPILTDPYQPVERRYRITRRCLRMLLEAGQAVAVLTRAARIRDDLELLCSFPRALVGFSIPTDDDRIRALFEPGGDPIQERIEALEAFCAAGVATVAFIQPMLPMDPDRLVDRVAPLVRAVRIDRMYGMDRVRHLYEENQLAHATTDAFFQKTRRVLRKGFESRGVAIDEMDDLDSLMCRASG